MSYPKKIIYVYLQTLKQTYYINFKGLLPIVISKK